MVVDFGTEIEPGTASRVWSLAESLLQRPFPGFIESVPAYTTLTVLFDPVIAEGSAVGEYLEQLASAASQVVRKAPREVEVPVCYGGDFGFDLDFVANHNQLTTEEVIRIHSESLYLVYMIGFAPGFPYLGGMSPRIAAPRLQTPRFAIPAGSVGIAGSQTGIYPLETPGGWRIIGRTPIPLFRPHEDPPSLLTAGDRVRFKPISQDEFRSLLPS